jgi:hypothetical protein
MGDDDDDVDLRGENLIFSFRLFISPLSFFFFSFRIIKFIVLTKKSRLMTICVSFDDDQEIERKV